MRPGGPEGGQNIESEGEKRKLREIIENLEKGILKLSEEIRTANFLLISLLATIIKHIVDEIREILYQEKSKRSDEEILKDFREILVPIDECMGNLALILSQTENNFEEIAQETEQLLKILSRKKR
jgi:septal ring factor EnvC (AmiA/AmiB activator)